VTPRVLDWLDERTGLQVIWRTVFDRKVPRVNWWYTLGSASLFLAMMQAVTGVFLTMYYVPTPEEAYNSIQYIMNDVAFGWLVRGIHHWGATLMVLTVFLHMLRVFYYGAYKYPREVTWVTGVVLLLLTVGLGFTGYLLPWNQRAYWATAVGTSLVGSVPLVAAEDVPRALWASWWFWTGVAGATLFWARYRTYRRRRGSPLRR